MKNIFKLLLVSLVFVSCEDAENTIFNGSAENGVFLSFESSSINFPVPRNVGGTFDLVLSSSTVSSVDRTYTLQIDNELSTANTANYDFPTQITIPAGEFQGVGVVQGFDVDLDAAPQTVVFSITNLQGEFMDDQVITLNLFEVCPLGAPFTGEYTVEQITPGFSNIGNAEIFGDDNTANLPVITLEMGNSEYERTITADVYPEAGSGLTTEFEFLITCDGINLTSTADVEVGCTGGPTLQFGAGTTAGAIDHDDDTTIQIRLTENRASACNGTPRQTLLQLTKVVN